MSRPGRYIPDYKFNKYQLRKGTKVELEHTSNRKVAKKIAKDHLAEHRRYYIELAKMEKRLKRRSKTRRNRIRWRRRRR